MQAVILLFLIHLRCLFFSLKRIVDRLPPLTLSLVSVEMVYTGDGYTLSVGGRTVNL